MNTSIPIEDAAAAAVSTVESVTPIDPLSMLTHEQKRVIDQLLQDKNVALLGAAGCGKSFLLSKIYHEFPRLKRQYDKLKHQEPRNIRIQICALTGCAALLLGNNAKTLHSWAGIGLGKGTVQELYTKIRRNRKTYRNWLCTDLLIIDEVSMLTADLLDKLNQLAKKLRGNSHPFGGIQVVFVGDFYQLPPVNKSDEQTKFAFEADAWKEIVNVTTELTKIQRQKDESFQTILKEARVGTLSRTSCQILEECQEKNWKKHKIRPTLIFPRRAEVDLINESNLKSLKGQRYHYKAKLVYSEKIPAGFNEHDEHFKQVLATFDSNATYATDLELALNAQVMLIANIQPEIGLVNGSRGVIVDFNLSGLPVVEFLNGIKQPIGNHTWPIEDHEFVARSQLPLRLAYAATMHKVQGSTLDAALIDIGSGIFEYGQAYVALSRVRSLDSLYVHDFDPSAFRVHPKVLNFYKNLVVYDEVENVLELLLTSPPIEKTDVKYNPNHLAADSASQAAAELEKRLLSKKVDLNLNHYIKPIHEVFGYSKSLAESKETKVTIHKDESIEFLEVKEDSSAAAESTNDNWLYGTIPNNWKGCLLSCEPKLGELSNFLKKNEFLPNKDHVWTALALTPLSSIKVVILGQDPYPTPGNGMGLAFSVLPEVRPLPASLKNIYKELTSDVGFVPPPHGDLKEWTKQGVLLLNTVLTVEPGKPQSHSKIGWEEVTDQIIRSIAAQTEGTIFVFWGKSAQSKKKLLDLYLQQNKHRVFESAHPSPLSASKGFFGSKPFSTINTWLIELEKEPIDWQI